MNGDQVIVFSKDEDSLPITTIKVENQPCADPHTNSDSAGTKTLPNEMQRNGECKPEVNTGLVFDDRFDSASNWEMSEAELMRQNGVFDSLYNMQPEHLLGSRFSREALIGYAVRSNSMPTWNNVRDYGESAPSRESNTMKIWMRPTISWPLRCESLMSRSDADEMMAARIESLGFTSHFWVYSVIIIILTVSTHFGYDFMKNERKKSNVRVPKLIYWLFKAFPILTRLFFISAFGKMSEYSTKEYEQCNRNIDRTQDF